MTLLEEWIYIQEHIHSINIHFQNVHTEEYIYIKFEKVALVKSTSLSWKCLFYPGSPCNSLGIHRFCFMWNSNLGNSEQYVTYDNGSLFAVVLVEFKHVLEWEVTDHITVEHKKRLVAVRQQLTSQSERTSWMRTEGQIQKNFFFHHQRSGDWPVPRTDILVTTYETLCKLLVSHFIPAMSKIYLDI